MTCIHRCLRRSFAAGFLLALVFTGLSSAQSVGTGTIAGRIFKPATGEYVRNAEIRVLGLDRIVYSGSGGFYQISNVPVGPATVRVASVGYDPVTVEIVVEPGQTVTQNIDLRSSALRSELPSSAADEPVQMAAYEVSTEREGHAKALQDQRKSMNLSSVVGSEIFGNVAEGNVGEFLKYLPGVSLEYVQADARSPRLRGMDPQYVNVTLDGVKLASADAFNATVGTENNGNEGSRAFGFESVSLSSVDSIEVVKVLSANLDADAAAGTIILRSKRAFDREGRRVAWQLNVSGNSEQIRFDETPGPGDWDRHKTRPGGILEYSDQYFNDRVGIVVNFTRSDVYNEQQLFSLFVSRDASAADPRIAVPQLITFTDGPKTTRRDSGTFTIDFRATPKLDFGVTTTLGYYTAISDNRQFRFQPAATGAATTGPNGRSTVIGDDPMVSFTTGPAANARVTQVGTAFVKLTNSVTIAPRFDWRPTDNFSVEGRFGYSYSNNDYEGLTRGLAAGTSVNDIGGVNSGFSFKAERPSIDSSSWTITQLTGADWSNLANYARPRVNDEGRLDVNEVFGGQLDFNLRTDWKYLTFARFGVKSREEDRKFRDARSWHQWEYVGPGGVTPGATPGTNGTGGSWAGYESMNPVDLSALGARFISVSGGPPTYPGRSRVGALFREHPEYFSHNFAETPGNYFNSFIGNTRDLSERVDAAYLMGNTRLDRFEVQAGLRFEKTSIDSLTFDQRPAAEVIAAGFTVDATGRANTIPGLQYQFESQPRKHVKGSYDNVFPSVSMKYEITPDLLAEVGFYKAISRPNLVSLAGVVTTNEQTLTINAPNTGLLPERSDAYVARLAYYLPPAGILSVGVFENQITDLRETHVIEQPRPEDLQRLGLDPEEYAHYRINTTVNGQGTRRFRGLELEYRQALTFLPGPLSGLNVFGTYTRNYADLRRGGLEPHHVSAGATFGYKRLRLSAKAIWTPDTPWTQNIVERFREERVLTDVAASVQLTRNINLSLDVRNVFNKPYRLMERRPEGTILVAEEVYGALWTLALNGSY